MHAVIHTPPPGQVHPLGRYTPWAGTPPGSYTPLSRYTPSRYTPPPPRKHTPLPPGSTPLREVHTPGSTPPTLRWSLQRMVRILLECFLVTGRNEVVAKVMFLQVSVILLTGGSPAGRTPPPHPPRRPPSRESPLTRRPPLAGRPPARRTPQQGEPTRQGDPPPAIRSMSGRYASYWNAFLGLFLYKKAPLLLFSSSKSEFQLSMKNEESGHECVIWFQLDQMGCWLNFAGT